MFSKSDQLMIQEADINLYFKKFDSVYDESIIKRNTYPYELKKQGNLCMINLLKSCKNLDYDVELPDHLIKKNDQIENNNINEGIKDKSEFNDDTSRCDVSNVTDMFHQAKSFNQPLNNFNEKNDQLKSNYNRNDKLENNNINESNEFKNKFNENDQLKSNYKKNYKLETNNKHSSVKTNSIKERKNNKNISYSNADSVENWKEDNKWERGKYVSDNSDKQKNISNNFENKNKSVNFRYKPDINRFSRNKKNNDILSKLILSLNKISTATYDKFLNEIINIEYDEDLLNKSIDEIIKKAHSSNNLLNEIYANLCYDLYINIKCVPDIENGRKKFRDILLDKCQTAFTNNIIARQNKIDNSFPNDDKDSKDEKKGYQIKLYLRYINFLGYLLTKDLLPINISFMIMIDMINYNMHSIEYNSQSFCQFFKITKEKMFKEVYENQNNLTVEELKIKEIYKKKIDECEKNCNSIILECEINSKTKFNLEDILKLINEKKKYENLFKEEKSKLDKEPLLNEEEFKKQFSEFIDINLLNNYKNSENSLTDLKIFFNENNIYELTEELVYKIFEIIMSYTPNQYGKYNFLDLFEIMDEENYISKDSLINGLKKIIDNIHDIENPICINYIADFLDYIIYIKKYENFSFFFENSSEELIDDLESLSNETSDDLENLSDDYDFQIDYSYKINDILKILQIFKNKYKYDIEFMKNTNTLPLNSNLINLIEKDLKKNNKNLEEIAKNFDFSLEDISNA
jgi:hypothetical protein